MTRTEENIARANSIKVGDECRVQGNKGKVEDVRHEVRDGVNCTYIKVDFAGCELEIFGQYNHRWYGCSDEWFNY